MTSKRFSEFTGLLWLIGGTFIVGLLIEFSLGGSRRFLPHFAYVPYFWGFVIGGLFYAYVQQSDVIGRWSTRRVMKGQANDKPRKLLHRFIKDPEGGVYRLDFKEDGWDTIPVAAWKVSPSGKSFERLDNRAIIGLLAPGEFTLIAESEGKTL